MLYYNTFNDKILKLCRKEHLRRILLIQSFSLSGYDELECRSFFDVWPEDGCILAHADHKVRVRWP